MPKTSVPPVHTPLRHLKIKPLNELAVLLGTLRAQKKRIVHCHGVFDLLHPGHIRHLEEARQFGDVLVVTVTQDAQVNRGPGRPVFNDHVRAESLAALGCVDFVAITHTPSAVETIRLLRPHFYVKGPDYKDKKKDLTHGIYEEEKAIRGVGGKLVTTSGPTMSSSHLLNSHFQVYPEAATPFLRSFRQDWTADTIIDDLKNRVSRLKVLVIGETIVDEYHYCQAMGKSPKENIVVTKYLFEESFAGGTLAAANHMAGFAAEVRLVTCLGKQESREPFIRRNLRPGVKAQFFYHDDRGTVVKRRFVDPNFLTKMFEVAHLEDRQIPAPLESQIYKYLDSELRKYDVVVVTDYGHGMLTSRLVDLLCRKSKFLCVNTQTNSANIGYNVITKYPRADYACIDEPELRLSERDKFGVLEDLVKRTAKRLRAKGMVVTRGHKGALGYSAKSGFVAIPVFSERVVDRTGAGDAYLCLSALCMGAGLPIEEAAFVGNAAGALKVGTVCNRTPTESVSLFKFITALLK
jgi:rfaE bifunctional protein nucleotidyltransferase chain/domain